MQPKARMTFRFEQPKPYQSTKSIGQPPNQVKRLPYEGEETVAGQGFTSFNSSYQDDIHALEEIIRQSDFVIQHPFLNSNQSPLTQREHLHDEQEDLDQPSEMQGGWILPPASIRVGPSWGRVFLSVSAAVATGALFGYMVLSLFTGEPLFPGKTSSPTTITELTAIGQKDIPATDSSALPLTSDALGESGVEVTLSQVPAVVYYMLQYGVFHSEDSMQSAVNELKDKGLPSATEKIDDYRVYVGAASTRDEAELLAAQMSNVEVYIKPLEGQPIPSSALPEGAVDFMNATAELTDKLIHDTRSRLQDKLPQVMSEKDTSALEDAHRQWLTTVSIKDRLSGRAIEEGKTIIQSLDSAMLSMTEYNRKPSRYQLWTAQSAVMKAVIADRHLRSILQPSSNR
jgi:hypothetical protein